MQALKRGLSVILSLAILIVCLAGVSGSASASEVKFEEVIAAQYEKVGEFAEGLAPVKKNGKWGYIDKNGEIVIACNYAYAFDFSEGYAVVLKGGETDKDVYEYEYAFIDHKGSETVLMMPDFRQESGVTYAPLHNYYYNTEQEMQDYLDEQNLFLNNGYLILEKCDELDSTALLFGTDGQLSEEYYNSFCEAGAEHFGEIQIYYCAPASEVGDNGYIAYRNTITIMGYTAVLTGSSKKIELVPPEGYVVLHALTFNQGYAGVFMCKYDDVYTNPENSTLFGVIDENGNWAIQPVFTRCWNTFYTGEIFTPGLNLACVADETGKFGAVDKSGSTVIPFEYDDLQRFYEGVAAFEKNGKLGYIDSKGKVVIAAMFDDAAGFNNGFAAAVKDGKACLIDHSGSVVSGSEIIDLNLYIYTDSSGERRVRRPDEYVAICKDGKYGFGHMTYTASAPTENDMPAWALPEVTTAIENNLVPTYLQNQYAANITRKEFATLAVTLVEAQQGKSIEDIVLQKTGRPLYDFLQQRPFLDTGNDDVIAAYALGLVNGTGSGYYSPYASITRQDSATLLSRLAQFCGKTEGGTPAEFEDSSEISSYAVAGVNFVSSLNIMNGTGNNKFSPKSEYTRQQAYITMNRLLLALH